MMSTKYTELSQLACFAHLLTSSHLHWRILEKFELFISELLSANNEAKLFKGPFLNIDSHCVMHCVVHR